MPLDDEIDERHALLKPSGKPGPFFGARHVIYAQLFAVIPCIVIGRGETLGDNLVIWVIRAGGVIFLPLAFFSVYICPFIVLLWVVTEFPQEKWALWSVPLSFALSFVLLLALLPAVQ
jgi:hypothetical protein